MTKYLACAILLACLTSAAIAGMTADSRRVAEVENIYADLNDAFSIITTIDSGLFTSYRGRDRAAWERVYREKRKEFGASGETAQPWSLPERCPGAGCDAQTVCDALGNHLTAV